MFSASRRLSCGRLCGEKNKRTMDSEKWRVQIPTSLLPMTALNKLFTLSESHFSYLKIGKNNVPQVGMIYKMRRVRIYDSLAHRRGILNATRLLCHLRAEWGSTFTFAASYVILINCLSFLEPQFFHAWMIMHIASHSKCITGEG